MNELGKQHVALALGLKAPREEEKKQFWDRKQLREIVLMTKV